MHSATAIITSYVLEKLETEKAGKRAEIYRALAEFSPSLDERGTFLQLADDCDAVATAHHQLTLDFQRRARGNSNGSQA